MKKITSLLLFCTLLMVMLSFGSILSAQDYPTRTIQLVSAFAPGGTTDITARALVSVFSDYLGQPGVVVPKPGGGGTVGTAYGATAPADGYTVTVIQIGPISLQPHISNVPYSIDDFAIIGAYNVEPVFMGVNKDAPYDTLEEFIAYAEENPGKVTFGAGAFGGMPHLSIEMLAQAVGVDMTFVTYDGDAPAITDAIAGHIDVVPMQPDSAHFVESGQLKALVAFTEERLDFLPDVPTAKEYGYDVIATLWRGLGVPKDTPEYRVEILRDALPKILEDNSFISLMSGAKARVYYMDPDTLYNHIKAETKILGELLEELGI